MCIVYERCIMYAVRCVGWVIARTVQTFACTVRSRSRSRSHLETRDSGEASVHMVLRPPVRDGVDGGQGGCVGLWYTYAALPEA